MLKRHGRQFVIGPEPVRANPDWLCSPVAGAGYLSRCPDLPAKRVGDADGREWWILGSPWATPPPGEQIASARTGDVAKLYRRWAGRWVLVGEGSVHMDAGGSLGCFYRGSWASSSAAVLAGEEAPSARELQHQLGMDWYPLPLSRFASLRRLLPSQILRLDGTVSPRPLLSERAPDGYEAVLRELGALLVESVRAAAETAGSLHLPLTAGYDSRLVLAAARAARVPVRAYTQGYPGMTRADRELPSKLAAIVGCEHTLVEPGRLDRARCRAYDEHASGHCADRDREFVARGQWDWCQARDVILRSGCFEVGRCGYYVELGDGPCDVDLILRKFPPQNPSARPAIAEWVAWCRDHPESMDWRDRFYWEQRVGGWLSTVEQSLDILPAWRGHVANSHRFYELALALPEDVRRASRHHVDLISTMAPELLELPFNPPDPLPVRLKRKALRALNEWYLRLAPAGR